jgi:hypothetical protein
MLAVTLFKKRTTNVSFLNRQAGNRKHASVQRTATLAFRQPENVLPSQVQKK